MYAWDAIKRYNRQLKNIKIDRYNQSLHVRKIFLTFETFARYMNVNVFSASMCARWENEMRSVNNILEWTFVGAGM